MIDGGAATEVGAGAETGGGAGAAAIAGDGGGAGGGGAAPEWMTGLPDDLKADATLARYADVPSLAKAHVEAHKVAKSKLLVPAADAAPEAWAPVWSALGLPEKADGYGDFGLDPLPADATDAQKQGRDAALGAYREALHKIGVPPKLAGEIVKADMTRIAEAERAYYAKGEEEIGALKKEMGAEYEPKRQAARNAFVRIFGEDAAPLADELETKVGSARLVKGMMKLAELTGEHSRVEGEGGKGFGAVADPEGRLRELNKDSGWRAKLIAGDAAVVAEQKNLLAAAQAKARRAAGLA